MPDQATINQQVRQRIQKAFRSRLSRAVYVPLIALILFAIAMGLMVNELFNRARQVEQRRAVIAQANRCFLLAVDLQSGLRGYQLTGSTNFLAPYRRAHDRLDAEFARFRQLLAPEPAELPQATALEQLVRAYIQAAESALAAGSTWNLDQHLQLKQKFDQIRDGFDQFLIREERAIEPASAELVHRARLLFALRLALAVVIGTLLAIFILRELRRLNSTYTEAIDELGRNEEFAAIVKNSNDAIISITLDGTITSWNPAAAQIFGYTSAETIGQPVTILYPPDRVKEEPALLARIQRGELIEHFETVRRRKDGTDLNVSLTLSPIKNSHGQVIGASKIARDISLQIQARDELTRINERLQEVDRLKSEFLATMSHELRTPLNSIIGFGEIIREGLAGPVNAEQKMQLGMLLNSARHLLHLINDLLDLARVESGRLEPVWEKIDASEVAAEVIQTLNPLAAQKNLQLLCDCPRPITLQTDRKMLFQIMLNLTNNAVKFTNRGHVRILVDSPPGHVRLRIQDTGIGIKPQDLGILFEAFRQVDGSARRRVEGTGLGLYLCKRLVTLLGGEIKVQSEYGTGSEFTVTLPARL